MLSVHTTTTKARPRPSTKTSTQDYLSYEIDDLVEQMVEEMSLTHPQAELLFEDTKKFLLIAFLNPDKRCGPSPAIDACWHRFILHTREYMRFCDQMFGTYIHHRPGQFVVTYEDDVARIAEKMFGSISNNWKLNGNQIDCSDCSPEYDDPDPQTPETTGE